ncbi:hypothetical protein A2229_01600 [Candidatus Peregrinibacteria bacterium RIFOXYA2_FULL_33_7]|nr:MAG: hypothetical protein UR30_C0002G0049 [Candidatus Peregrinibacteria bacterium GW2011_GWC2_33_13]OGJ46803.1 MAG: hypothetical protein A2229_01600 [Candidatus Peregrinibacteria bacterium RIFOXYA2_FULL_33_7]
MKNPEIFLKHILESIIEIENNTKKLKAKEFYQTIYIQDAVIRRLEIIGEAVKNIPKPFRDKYSSIPWIKIAGLRDVLIHNYFGVDIYLVWQIVIKDLPDFKKQVTEILKKK